MCTIPTLRTSFGRLIWVASILTGLHIAVAVISHRFQYPTALAELPILTFVALMLLAGGAYLLGIRVLWRNRTISVPRILVLILITGVLMRIAFFFSLPVLEDDFYRYLWDGGVTVHGQNPYAFAPARILDGEMGGGEIPDRLVKLARTAENLPERVNHPDLRTLYPPVAQAAFGLAHLIDPWGLSGWRGIIILAECVTVALMVAVLRHLKLPLSMVAVYWWNPLVVKEFVNSGHMDVLILPFVLGALLCVLKCRYAVAGGILAFATGVKLWPIVLLPLFLRPLLKQPRQLVTAAVSFAGVAILTLVPFIIAATGENSGLQAYSQQWQINDALFMLLSWIIQFVVGLFDASGISVQTVTRVAVIVLLCGWLVYLARHPAKTNAELTVKSLLIVAGVFLLSPTQFPWYGTWFIPLLALSPGFSSLLLLTALLPLYYLRFHFMGTGQVEIFDYGVVWLEYVPVWALLVWEALKGKRELSKRLETDAEVP